MKQTLTTKILNLLLVIFGFASATSCDDIGGIECEYGTPTMDFEVSGKVVDQKSAPIAGIKVTCTSSYEPGIGEVLTAKDGSFSITGTGMSARLEFTDIDGAENGGEFTGKTEDIKVAQVKKGDGKWYMGKYEAKDVVVKMTEKE